ncbi:hypothetical protein [Streptomyces aidingensis]|uniref:Iron complex transport system ATP-binding protein n=1 Tax=Streptomyces aidingensis TaxID=910347 RepID=A0A1I1L761_9ACTN|nr:hypothetical protein [Streptomyces aidingensis]SFC68815.1 iron complex transport system ATP-binding protein [Streptomyces aidingensis]
MLAGGRVLADGPVETVLTAELLTAVYRHPVEVLGHPEHGGALILPVRGPRRAV